MIDRFIYKFFGAIDNAFDKVRYIGLLHLDAICRDSKGKVKEEVILEVDKTFENEIKK